MSKMESFRIFGDWGECLAQSGLDNFDALFGCRGGSKYRQVPGRLTVRISLPDPAGGERHMYLKRYTRVPLGEGLRRLFSIRRPSS
ncbi:MAG: hypothetical protein QF662_08775, partial [Phycisphaerae bacterium]|nr:hypothetical protein [Phycisphaerae bacterium]